VENSHRELHKLTVYNTQFSHGLDQIKINTWNSFHSLVTLPSYHLTCCFLKCKGGWAHLIAFALNISREDVSVYADYFDLLSQMEHLQNQKIIGEESE